MQIRIGKYVEAPKCYTEDFAFIIDEIGIPQRFLSRGVNVNLAAVWMLVCLGERLQVGITVRR